jgi:hypothetical protein
MYSNRAIPQLAKAAMYHCLVLRFFRWPYQAKVMNRFDNTSNNVVFMKIGMDVYSSPVLIFNSGPALSDPYRLFQRFFIIEG